MYRKDGAISGGYIHRQVLALQELGVEVSVVCPIPRLFPGDPLSVQLRKLVMRPNVVRLDDIDVTYLPYWNVPNRVSAAFVTSSLSHSLAAYLGARNGDIAFDLVHANRLFPQGYAALSVARRFSVPLLVGVQGSDIHTNPFRVASVGRFTRSTIEAARLYAVSADLARQVTEFATPSGPVHVVYNGVDVEQFRPLADRAAIRKRLSLPETGIGIVTVARLVAEKGIWELLTAFDGLARTRPELWLAVVGDGPLRNPLNARIRQLGLDRRVFLAGAQPNRLVNDWLNACDVFALASYNEGLPNVVLEAMATALPVVATDVGGVREAVVDGSTGHVIPARDVGLLERALAQLVDDRDARHAMGRAGLDRVRQQFLWSQSAESLRSLYEDLLGSRIAQNGSR
jgi:glycosyltransferase involved in cell wall biosynthesis